MIVNRIYIYLLFTLLLLTLGVSDAIAGDLTGRARVIDADTLELAGERVRLHGVDAPESEQPCYRGTSRWMCGDAATQALRQLTQGKTVRCQSRGQDKYGRHIALCDVGGVAMNAWLVRNGWALDWPRYSDGAYAAEQRAARNAGLGVWGSTFEKPWEWRWRQ